MEFSALNVALQVPTPYVQGGRRTRASKRVSDDPQTGCLNDRLFDRGDPRCDRRRDSRLV